MCDIEIQRDLGDAFVQLESEVLSYDLDLIGVAHRYFLFGEVQRRAELGRHVIAMAAVRPV